MPVFALPADAYGGGEDPYVGHQDLFFKRFSFQTVRPFEVVGSTAAHTALSRLLREKCSPSRLSEVRKTSSYTADTSRLLISSTSVPSQHPVKQGTQSPQDIADFYIKKALARSHQEPVDKIVDISPSGRLRPTVGKGFSLPNPSASLPTVSVAEAATSVFSKPKETTAPRSDPASLDCKAELAFPTVTSGLMTRSRPPLENISSNPLANPLLHTSLTNGDSLLTSSSTCEKSFDFLGTPTIVSVVPEPISKLNHLTDYSGSRPSFGVGTITSTPFTLCGKPTKGFAKNEEKENVGGCERDGAVQGLEDAALAGSEATARKSLGEESPDVVSFLEDCYAVQRRLAEDYDKAKKRVEENKEQKTLRVLIKRTIVEKVTVESKRTASEQGIRSVSSFLCKLFTGTSVIGYGDKPLRLPGGDAVCYAYLVTVESYMAVVERDPPLALVISKILVYICEGVPNFESLLVGKVMRTSQMLSLNEEKCAEFAKRLAASEDRRFALIPETSIIKLFVHLHIVGATSKKTEHFTSNALWNLVLFLVNEKPRTLATAAILLEIVESGFDHLRKVQLKKWLDVLDRINGTLIPNLEAAVNNSDLRRTVGEDTIVSSLRHAISRRVNI